MDNFVNLIEEIAFDTTINTVIMCGKIKYEDYMRELAALSEYRLGWNVLIPIDCYKAIRCNPRLEKSKMNNFRKIHYDKIYKSNSILVYVDKNHEFLDSENVMSEILAALSYEKDIYFSKLLRDDVMKRISSFINSSTGIFGKRFKVKFYKSETIDTFIFTKINYTVIRGEE